jgi:hypothetical protein
MKSANSYTDEKLKKGCDGSYTIDLHVNNGNVKKLFNDDI